VLDGDGVDLLGDAQRHVEIRVGEIRLKGMSARKAERLLNKAIEFGDVGAALGAIEEQAAEDAPDDSGDS
jgi:hypothetical protein